MPVQPDSFREKKNENNNKQHSNVTTPRSNKQTATLLSEVQNSSKNFSWRDRDLAGKHNPDLADLRV